MDTKGARASVAATQKKQGTGAAIEHARTILDTARLAGLANLAPHLALIDSAIKEYAAASRDADEGLRAANALKALQQLAEVLQ